MQGATGKGKWRVENSKKAFWGEIKGRQLESCSDERHLLANNTSPRFTMTRLDLQRTSYCFPHLRMALFNIENRNIDKWHLYTSFLPQLHVIHGSLI
jgi:hypothetical protein